MNNFPLPFLRIFNSVPSRPSPLFSPYFLILNSHEATNDELCAPSNIYYVTVHGLYNIVTYVVANFECLYRRVMQIMRDSRPIETAQNIQRSRLNI